VNIPLGIKIDKNIPIGSKVLNISNVILVVVVVQNDNL